MSPISKPSKSSQTSKASSTRTPSPPMFKFKPGTGKQPKVTSVVGSNSSKYPNAVWVLPVFQAEASTGAKTKNAKKAGNSGAYLGELTQAALAEHELMQLQNIVAREPELAKPNAIRIAHCNHDHSISLTVVLVGLGQKEQCTLKTLKKASEAAGKATQSLHAQQVVWGLLHDACHNHPNLDLTQATTISVQALLETHYRFEACKKAADPALSIPEVLVYGQTTHRKALETGIARATALAHGTALCKDLGNLPSNICTPVFLANLAQDLASHYKLKLDVLTPTQMEKLGMHSLLSVGKASINPPRLIVLEYRGPGAGKQAPIVLLGKGITFDTGGISLKPGAAMDEMKYDMCGAASVLSTLKVCCELRLPINLTVVVVAAENMPAGNASKPGDIVVSMSGQTIEILNTDAEGRLILCDALTYIQRFKPEVVIDVATLTGACVVALGHVMSGLYSPQEHLAKALMDAGKQALDPAWQMPLDETYAEQLKSNFADMANIGGPPAGSVTAACFLQKFVDGFDWAHLDIAGTAWRGGEAKGATGRPVSLLSQYLIQRCYPDAP